MAKVVKGAKLIVLAVPALSHEYYLKTLVPLLEDGMVIDFSRIKKKEEAQ